ncbi:tRNA (adenosine(37)-N6)-threonylcarbamoyltransferase complex ATPase subunit type 1 TsaE [Rhizobium lentis]|uniref:tRNA (adenosine(37)-N6)-threonylcarbamoyltransferase complex ATPase subunit type 1 TsaE n=1 Tax=Rhizobium lentis TaxID=1138194 RepID=UPI001C83E61F|nr:tRNA (adenosine(37)-N6)-threonylcarbamoyltransferase complex ATPase subunit type 1 TsaE [Rhizobium lentis]MBX4958490.1 tRNA (adenosine(37)-N6)-threonylcarbamoyltransferase complex ATPase subunit type 1 TsaE [Rhizobium lentis]MBX4976669.1 tRNA (adenosine(37)-N6)-threonylcarbamoyltransferase complex ATPase subunit type 1 TsaE [Rhizobium lentis]MBX4988496.1 tRNA (adenosine(37)-N6)-threonylcarbamoyltransferase complex ATPase subunit type 1 TsaE [Rhizobium lentis]MBX5006945.1 tRNA (adenosine(37)-
MTTDDTISLFLEDEAATIRLGEDLALALKAGDCLALSGDLGAGKSSLARAILRAIADDEGLEVPSPTFTLVQSYDLRIPVSHFDLYRLGDPSELTELGFDEALENGICLVEWPEMAAGELPVERITLTLAHEGNGRRATIAAAGAQALRIRRVLAIRNFLDDAGYPDAKRRFLTGDASLRAYEAIHHEKVERRIILMDWRPHPEGPPVYDGKPYPKVAHLAQDAYPFVAIANALRERGFAAPEIFKVDYTQGILLIEDLGTEGVLDDTGRPIAERYRQSVACLAQLHSMPFPRDIPVTATHTHHIPDFDRTALKMEVQLVLDWHIGWKRGTAPSEAERKEYLAIWDGLIDELATAEKNLLLRDFHSPNIIWRPRESGVKKIGLIDFQDAMIGPTAYDLASIVQDARVTIEPDLFRLLMDDYLALRHAQGGFDEAGFLKAWAIMSAQRNCKLAGLWVRLLQRDGKPGYFRHMPRTLAYLNVALEHEALAPLRDWCARAGIGQSES